MATGLAGTGLAAKFGIPLLADGDPDASEPESPSLAASTLYLDRYTLHSNGRGPERHKGDQSLLRGTLTTDDGARAGELFATAITMPGPIDGDSPRTPRMELQTLQLTDGTIMAMGTVFAQSDIPNVYTVVGGTGRYLGTRGSYRFDENPAVARPDGRSSIVFDLST